MRQILELLEQDGRLTPEEIGVRLGMDADDVAAAIADAEASRSILGYSALVNWEATDAAKVYAFIAVEAIPERETGFEAIADHISRFDEVHSVYLMSGTSDLQVVVEGDGFREIAQFVGEKLAPIDGVRSTATSFVLKTYKLEGRPALEGEENDRLAVSP